ncbi:biotin--[acetyl-CoA-carboxylase] ligase [Xylanibacter muris]|uniref:Biotin--[acetyl-CoA-carboxylase] ligase n=1 Tax=Xylanibacter muris TaxID=2736290 RepID=A0ABX2AL14_9BACT|nr:biotin--[acetyl-CoA-carboxylase] ligase [Xylanibacter muris]NPD91883.1 biotin--[acetyl-CoA-carboxylase] ligase [Xylanibacter muris]
MEKIKILRIDSTDSTNRYLHDHTGEEGTLMTVVSADFQTAGRGQGSNTWESERGANLIFSIKTHPVGIPANRQFVMLEAKALAIKETLEEHLASSASAPLQDVTIKWPNDIYYGNNKISGTLSECSIQGGLVKSCITGSGININQKEFISDAPNPISIRQITGRDTDREKFMESLLNRFEKYLDLVNSHDFETIDSLYTRSLYRNSGIFRYEDRDGVFQAEICGITPEGHLLLQPDRGTIREYEFKEVKFII